MWGTETYIFVSINATLNCFFMFEGQKVKRHITVRKAGRQEMRIEHMWQACLSLTVSPLCVYENVCTSHEVIFRQISIWRAWTSHMCKNIPNPVRKDNFLLILFIFAVSFTLLLAPKTRFCSFSPNRTERVIDRRWSTYFVIFHYHDVLFCYMQKTNMWFLFFLHSLAIWREKTAEIFLWTLRRQPLSVELIAQTVIVVCREKQHTEQSREWSEKEAKNFNCNFPKSIYLGLIINSWICGFSSFFVSFFFAFLT